MGGRAEMQSFCSPLCICLGAFCPKKWFNLIIFLWHCNEVIYSQKVPCSHEPADTTHVCVNCINAFALPARSSCSVHFIINGLTPSSLNAKEKLFLTPRTVPFLFVNHGVTFARGGRDGTSPAFPQVGFYHLLAPRFKAAPWPPPKCSFSGVFCL